MLPDYRVRRCTGLARATKRESDGHREEIVESGGRRECRCPVPAPVVSRRRARFPTPRYEGVASQRQRQTGSRPRGSTCQPPGTCVPRSLRSCARSRAVPVPRSSRFSLPSAKNAMEPLLGDQHGSTAPSVRSSGRADTASSWRSHNCDRPSVIASKTICCPSGDTATDCPKLAGGVTMSRRSSRSLRRSAKRPHRETYCDEGEQRRRSDPRAALASRLARRLGRRNGRVRSGIGDPLQLPHDVTGRLPSIVGILREALLHQVIEGARCQRLQRRKSWRLAFKNRRDDARGTLARRMLSDRSPSRAERHRMQRCRCGRLPLCLRPARAPCGAACREVFSGP